MQNIAHFNQRIRRFIRRLRRTERGAVAVIVALAVVPLMVGGGLAVDLSRAYLVKSRLSHALDAAGLAVGTMRTNSTSTTYLETQFNNFFTANYPSSEVGSTHDLTFIDNGGIITVSGKTTVNTVFMSIVGIDTITVSSTAEIKVETKGLELVMVLDNTGSMSGSKLASMKSASLDLIDIVFGGETAPDFVKIGLVPFSGSVNIGSANTAYVTDPGAFDWGTTSWEGCVEARSYPDDVNDASPSLGGLWTPYYWAHHDSYNDWDQDGGSYNIDSSPPSTKGPNKYCPRAVTPLTNNRTTLESEINAQWAAGYTHINYGAVWGWRLISPSEPFTQGSAYNDPDWSKAVIILTDGDNTTHDKVDTAYGYRSEGLLGSTSGSGTTAELNSRLTQVCTAMKNENILVYTITFNVSSTTTQALFENCATSSDKYFNSPDSTTLTQAFRAIGAELKNLHLSK